MSEAGILRRRDGRLGRITLDRPQALNALTLGMVRALATALDEYEADPGVALVLIDAAGPRAFCAGGDVAALHAAGLSGDHAAAAAFWAEEYRLDDRIARFAKPVVALVHGFCLGGGVGLACHARHRILGESARIAMPECGIGLVPDVGGTALLARAPRGIGAWMALTGARLEPGPAIAAGFADRFVPEARWDALRHALAADGDARVLSSFAAEPPAPHRALPDADLRRAFDRPTVGAILAALSALASPAAPEAAAALGRGSPLAMATALEMQRRLGPRASLRAALTLEFHAVRRALAEGDFLEGVRARIIDRDDRPVWRHGAPDSAGAAEVAAQLAPMAGDDLRFRPETTATREETP